MSRYATIVADPPWRYDDGFSFKPSDYNGGSFAARPLPYEAMDLEEIAALPVASLAEKDARLFLWTTNRYLPEAFPLLAHWGFRYRQALVWHKINAQPGPASVAVLSAEFLLVGVRGAPERLSKLPSAVIQAPRSTHSTKPEVFLDLVEQVSGGPYLEMFSRRARLGWSTWGNEALEGEELMASGL